MGNEDSRSKALVYTSLAHFINDGTVSLVPLIGAIFAAKAISPLAIGLMFVVFNISSSVLSTYVGAIADRTGRPGSMIGMGLGLLSLGILGFSGLVVYGSGYTLAVLLVLSAFLAGFGNAFIHPLMATVLQLSYREKSMGKALGVNGAIGSLGRALYPTLYFLATAFLAQDESIAFFALMGFAASVLVWVGFMQKRQPNIESKATRAKYRVRDLASRSTVILIAAAFVRSLAVGGILNWIPTYISLQKGVGVTTLLGLSLTAMYAAAIVGQPIFGLLVGRFDKRLIMGVSSVGSALSILGYIFTTGVVEISMLVLFGFLTLSAFPLFLSLASDYVPREAYSLGNALVWGLGVTGGQAIGPAITTAIIVTDYAKLGFAFEVMALIFLISVVVTAFIPRPDKRGESPPFSHE